MQVLKGRCARDHNARVAVELLRSPDQAILAMFGDGGYIDLVAHPLSWFEIGQEYQGGKKEFHFDDQFRPLMRTGPQGPEPYPVLEAVRKIIRGCHSEPAGFRGGSLNALVDVLPGGSIHLFTRESGFVGRFCSIDDAAMIAKAMQATMPVIFETPEELKALATLDLGVVLTSIDPTREWPAKLNSKQAKEVFEMASKQEKKKAAKVEKAEAKQRRADGPVAKARELFAKMKDKDTAEIIKACEDAGINRGTATTQLGRWRKENGIVVKRGGARKKKETPAKSDTTKAGDKKGSKGKKKKKDKKPEAAKGDGIPKGSSKRHKPAPQSPSSPSSPSSASTPSANSTSSGSAAASSPSASSESAASTHKDAASHTAASGDHKPAGSGG